MANPPRDHQHIDLRLNEVNQLFHSLDPSPFREKDLDAQAEEFIVDWAKELARSTPLLLTIHLARQPLMEYPEQAVKEAVRNYFRYRAEQTTRQYRELLRQGWKDLGIGLLFLFSCLLFAEFLTDFSHTASIAVLRESLIIGGWVAMWRPMEIFLYDRWPLKRRQSLYTRLSTMEVRLEVSTGVDPRGT
ncbi:MAG: hypothetical protein A3H91_14080 [Gammaproteobacteria bacterium RIFCSPLOWO2_02_FULL_61_13]|nr:MAG: hypothetical protein A3H91_14080 [Gammaproteobacteria bacterium RIFCSPLOWO2_02_FULL_61_13]